LLTSLYHLFPPYIHPMVIHFTIAIIYLCGLAGLVGLFRRGSEFAGRSFQILLVLGILATIAAGLAGVISEYYLPRIPAGVPAILAAHRRDGELTGVLMVLATIAQVAEQRLRPRVAISAFVLSLAAVVMVSITGDLGGSMVYGHGLGVR
jgi:uncharacterized membrane protein